MRLDAQVRSSGDVEGRLAAVGDNRDRVGSGAAVGEKDSFCSKFITSEVERQLTEGEGNNIIDRDDQERRRRRRRSRDRGPKDQMAPTRRKEQQQQQVSSVGAHQTTASLIESLSVQGAGSGADQMASLAQMSSYLMNSFHNNQQQQQTFSQQAPQVQSPLNGFMSAAALASVAAARHHQQQQQQRDLLLSQFASLHSLSAVASAIQQQHQNQQSSNFNLVDNQSPSFSSCLSERLAQSLAGSNQQHAHQPPYHVGGGGVMHQATSGPATGGGVPFPAGFASIPPSTLVSSLGTSTSSAQYQQQPGARHLRPRRRGARKCRKMYGMAQRQLWCTQCKWKKACSRFLAQMVNGNHQVAVSSSTSS